MSHTIRRKKFNKKNRPFIHYWEEFSEKSVANNKYIEVWKYHSDNYYTRLCKKRKQYYKNQEDRVLRRHTKLMLHHYDDYESIFLEQVKPRTVRHKVH